MAFSRPPGDTSVKSRSVTVNSYYYPSAGGTATATASHSIVVEQSRRPRYGKGVVITVPGGGKFRKSTPYEHRSWELKLGSKPGTALATDTNELFEDYGGESDIPMAGDPGIAPGYPPLDAHNEAVTKALNKIADQKVNLGENLATLGKTLRMFTSRGEFLKDALNNIGKNKDFKQFLNKSARDIFRDGPTSKAAQLYLEYVYGLKPLMQDVFALHKLMTEQSSEPLLLHGKGSAIRSPTRGISYFQGNYTIGMMKSATGSQKTTANLWAIVDPDHRGLRSLNQLGLTNPASLAWELVPWSFVVDWFIPIGPMLQAMTAPMGLLFVDGCVACRTKGVFTWNTYTHANGFYIDSPRIKQVPFEYTITEDSYHRHTLDAWPTPGPWFATDPLKADRPLKALALAIVQLSRTR